MRIEISAGGVCGVSVLDFRSEMGSFLSAADDVIASFKTIKSSTYSLSGGVGDLQDALDEIDERLRQEEKAKQDAESIGASADGFIQLAVRVDKQVAEAVNKNKEEDYRVMPWLAAAVTPLADRAWYEEAWNWLCGVGEDIAEGAEKAWDWVSDTAQKAWDGLVEFYNENKRLCQILIGVAAIAIAVVVTVFTGGAAIPALLAMAKAAIVGGLVSAAIGGSVSAVMSLVSGDSLDEALDEALNAAVDGFCSGFMWGGIFAAGSQIISCLNAVPKSNPLSHSEQMDVNRQTGAEFADKNSAKLSKKYSNAQREISIETPSGTRTRVDYIAQDKNGNLIIREFKSSQTAPLTKNQANAFPEIFESGGVVKGTGKGIFSGGFSVPPGTEVVIIRPDGILSLGKWIPWAGGIFGQMTNAVEL